MNVAARQAHVNVRADDVELDGARHEVAKLHRAQRLVNRRGDDAGNVVKLLAQLNFESPIDNVNFARRPSRRKSPSCR